MVAVAPPSLCGVVSAAAIPAEPSRPATASPDTSVAAARRAAPRLNADDADNEENTEFPFEQDPLTLGGRSHQQNQKPQELRLAS
ncbi:hypothetical protein GCM10022207_14450 [Streptomyces lannensis]|uniref:Secreted protein n=1 Tax=Streptomyces lannensis TaxID=766498 RepID=A0ABP7JRV6_9ACTN